MTRTRGGYCPQCRGVGKLTCSTCNGSGNCTGIYIHTSFFGDKSTVTCQNGACPRCRGTGKDDAFLIKDRCIMCSGSRICPTCRGTGRCLTCNGTGKVDCQACGN